MESSIPSRPSLTESPAPTSLPLVVDSNQEKGDTRAQPPQHSPIASRAAFPPATQYQAFLSQLSVANSPQWTPLPTPGQASGFPLTNQQPIAQQPDRSASTELTPQHSQSNHPHNRSNNRLRSASAAAATATSIRGLPKLPGSGSIANPNTSSHGRLPVRIRQVIVIPYGQQSTQCSRAQLWGQLWAITAEATSSRRGSAENWKCSGRK